MSVSQKIAYSWILKRCFSQKQSAWTVVNRPLASIRFFFLWTPKFHLPWICFRIFYQIEIGLFFQFSGKYFIWSTARVYILDLLLFNHETSGQGGRGGEGQFDCLPFGFNKNMFFRERMKLWFFATFSTCSENLKIL